MRALFAPSHLQGDVTRLQPEKIKRVTTPARTQLFRHADTRAAPPPGPTAQRHTPATNPGPVKSAAGPTAPLTGQTDTAQQTPFLARAPRVTQTRLGGSGGALDLRRRGDERPDARPPADRRAGARPWDIIASANNIRLRVNTANKSDRERGPEKITGKLLRGRGEEEGRGEGEKQGEAKVRSPILLEASGFVGASSNYGRRGRAPRRRGGFRWRRSLARGG